MWLECRALPEPSSAQEKAVALRVGVVDDKGRHTILEDSQLGEDYICNDACEIQGVVFLSQCSGLKRLQAQMVFAETR